MRPARSGGREHVGINAHLISGQEGYRRAGIHHYITQLLNHLPQSDQGLSFTIFTNNPADLVPNPAGRVVSGPWPTRRRTLRILWEQLAWPVMAVRRELDLVHSLAFVTPILNPCPAVVTVYDLSFVHYPKRYPALQRIYLASQTRRSCRSARRVVAISQSGRRDVHELFGVPLEQIDVVSPGVAAEFQRRPVTEIEAFRQRERLPSRFVLHVGTLQPRKNIPVLIEAFAKLRRPDVGLVLVGGKGWFYEEIFARVRELSLQEQVRFAGYVPDADLPLWYNAVAVLVFPSVYEGFGMPVVQAMACGTRVVATNASAIPEAAGGVARMFDALDVEALSHELATILDQPELAAAMGEQGQQQAKQFSWQQAGRDMLAVYQRALSE